MEAETVEECCVLAHSLKLAQPCFLNISRLPDQGWHHPQWAGPPHRSISFISQDKCSHRLLEANLTEAIPQLKFFSSQMILDCITLISNLISARTIWRRLSCHNLTQTFLCVCVYGYMYVGVLFIYVYIYMCKYEHVCAAIHRDQKWALNLLEL
jgi:hypothetical protein